MKCYNIHSCHPERRTQSAAEGSTSLFRSSDSIWSLKMAVLLLLTAVSCSRFDVKDKVFENSAYLDVSAFDRIQTATFSNTAETAAKELSVALAYPEDKDITATVSVDESLVSDYNSRYGTDYQLLPAQYLDFEGATVTVEAGKVSSEKVVIGFRNLMGEGEGQEGAMEIDKTWLLPVSLSSKDIDVMKSSATAYYLVKRSSAITVAVQLTDDFLCFPRLDDPAETELKAVYNDLTAVTYEALVYIDRYDTDNVNISTVMGMEQYLLLRIGDANFERQQLQFDGSGGGTQFGKVPSKSDAAKKLSTGQWYHVAATYDQATRIARIYLNGKLLDEAKDAGSSEENRIRLAQRTTVNGQAGEGYCFLIGNSYNRDRPLQGKIAEARVWRTARTQQEIWDNMYRIDSPESYEDLLGYWKCNDGKGDTVTDYSRYRNHAKFGAKEQWQITTGVTVDPKEPAWATNVEIPEINK